jgi:copper chaperone
MSEVIELTVNGMTCGGCENSVKRVLMQTAGVEAVAASHTASLVGVTFDPAKVTPAVLREKIEGLGYEVSA